MNLPLNQVILGDCREVQSIDTIVTELDWLNMNGVFSWKVNVKGYYDQNRGTKVNVKGYYDQNRGTKVKAIKFI